jgi:hypothetical protein
MDNGLNNGLLTKIWGPATWEADQAAAFGYPTHPTEIDKANYRTFFEIRGHVLPCKFCRESYLLFITTGDTKLTDDVFESRKTLTEWIFRLHNAVNNKLDVDYGTTYKHLCDRYEAFRAVCDPKYHGCIMPLNLKANAFKIASNKMAAIIDIDTAYKFVDYAQQRGLNIKPSLDFVKNIHIGSNSFDSNEWEIRNKKCWKLIKKMRYNSIPALECDGKYKDLPTLYELGLIALACSTLSKTEFNKVAIKVQHC